jgi:hypothetical protein
MGNCGYLMAMSWIVAFHPSLALAAHGILVKNYIDRLTTIAPSPLIIAGIEPDRLAEKCLRAVKSLA